MFRFFLLCVTGLLFVLSGCECLSKDKGLRASENNLKSDFANAYQLNPFFDKTTKVFGIQVELEDGYHAYAAGESIGRPVNLEILNFDNWRAVGSTNLPKGFIRELGTHGKSVILEDGFIVSQKVEGGPGDIQGILKMQLCSESACDRPRTYGFKYSVKKSKFIEIVEN